MGQYAILIVLSAFVLGGVVLYNAQQKVQGADDDLTTYHEDRFGRELALVGLKRTERLLATAPEEWDLFDTDNAAAQTQYGAASTTYTKSALTGTYAVTYDAYTAKTATTPALATVTATGVYNGKSYTVRATYEQGETDIGVPPSQREAIVADDRLYINGNVEVSGSIHSNDCLDSSGNSFEVLGSGTYTGCEGANDARFTGGLTQGDSIYVPPVTMPSTYTHQTTAGAAVSLGDQVVDLTTASITAQVGGTATSFPVTGAGTATNPYVLVILGDLSIDGDVRFLANGFNATGDPNQGHIRIYVQGSVDVKGNSVIAPVSPLDGTLPRQQDPMADNYAWREAKMPDGGSLGIYATGGVQLNGTVTIIAQLYANGVVEYKGGGQKMVLGGITTQQTLELKGNSQVVYTDPNASILNPGFIYQTPDGIRLASYREWATRTP